MENQAFADTKLKLKLGESEVLVSFGIFARRRIEEKRPGFSVFEPNMAEFEVVPFLIQCGVEPENQMWSTEKEFIELYEDCTDFEALDKILLAYSNALGFTNQRFVPLITKLNEQVSEVKESLEKSKKKHPTGGKTGATPVDSE
ncbi:hypothetical protein LZG74_16860 [Dyadobacter sp. CY327]|uniref:hypothetical protein n=1 Tax=Dyadobacter sp. CY327 TaxID=2907301 RepID=UPI001F2E08CD|nr:hypothetical protein [Dyadobacter sp. CY327]MCE7071989.1 hypothetical protein [Dyadobacter sp. CY327]